MIYSGTAGQKKRELEDKLMKTIPIGRVDHFEMLYSAARSKLSCDVVDVKTRGNLLKVVDSIDKQCFTLT